MIEIVEHKYNNIFIVNFVNIESGNWCY